MHVKVLMSQLLEVSCMLRSLEISIPIVIGPSSNLHNTDLFFIFPEILGHLTTVPSK